MNPMQTYRILMVDDNPDHAVLAEVVFGHMDANARVSVAWSAEEAIEALEGVREQSEGGDRLPDVIVLDINMPGMGGLGFMDWYSRQADLQQVPVVVFTSSGDPTLKKVCLALGARDFKQKPSDFTELVPVVQSVVGRWRPGGEVQSG